MRLDRTELAEFLESVPAEWRGLVRDLRDLVLRTAPEVEEAVRFHALAYFKPGRPYGSIGGNVCLITPKPGGVRLEFLHGASLPDPGRLLRGSAKAKRHVELRELPRPGLRALILAARQHDPAGSRTAP